MNRMIRQRQRGLVSHRNWKALKFFVCRQNREVDPIVKNFQGSGPVLDRPTCVELAPCPGRAPEVAEASNGLIQRVPWLFTRTRMGLFPDIKYLTVPPLTKIVSAPR